jgi:hypothetical protein
MAWPLLSKWRGDREVRSKDEQNYRTLKSATQQKPNRSASAGNIKKYQRKIMLITDTQTTKR